MTPRRRSPLAVAAGLLVLALSPAAAGCSRPAPAAADPRFDGAFAVSSLSVGGTEVTLDHPVTVGIDAAFGQLTVETGCNRKLGAYSLLADGRAGVTLAGGTRLECAAGAREQEKKLLSAFDKVSSWEETGSGLVLHSPDGDEIELTR